jgi:hypothetical protein
LIALLTVSRGRLLRAIGLFVVWPSLSLHLAAGSAQSQTSPANYVFLLASGFLCDPGDSGDCPAVAKSENGDTYEISGAGTFDTQSKFVEAAGTFNHKATNGTILETGVWLASELISFDSYGIAPPSTLIQRGPIFRIPQAGVKRPPMRPGSLPTGGLAIFRIVLMTVSGTTKAAVLQVNCALGDVPSERSAEGIRLSLEQAKSEYSEELSGRVVFISMRPEKSPLAKP